jgi:hypothetical protein
MHNDCAALFGEWRTVETNGNNNLLGNLFANRDRCGRPNFLEMRSDGSIKSLGSFGVVDRAVVGEPHGFMET